MKNVDLDEYDTERDEDDANDDDFEENADDPLNDWCSAYNEYKDYDRHDRIVDDDGIDLDHFDDDIDYSVPYEP